MAEVNLIEDATIVPVKNVMRHDVGYTTLNGIRRYFAPGLTMNITAGELRELSYVPGGLVLLQDYLQVGNAELAREFGIEEDMVEYNWNEKDIEAAVTTADLDVLLDALDFAPDGIKEAIKDKAIELEIPDKNRIQAINKAMNCDIETIIRNKHAYDTAADKAEETPKVRRTAPKKTTNRRRTSTKKTEGEETAEGAEE